jgi:lipid II:glycine glycyltransferase (peptidoglycan interpeptide bridge formation enzyme)
VRRKLLVRIVPNVCTCDADASSVRRVFEESGFTTRPATYRTYYVDLTQSREQLEAGLSRGWKRSLKKAASQNVEVRIGTSDKLFLDYLALYAEMQERKRFLEGVDVYEYRRIQECLAAEDKLQIMVAYVDGRPAAAVIYSYLGEKGIVLIGATGHAGVNLGINHLINLRMIEQGLDVPASWFDYGGYNPEKVPGTARFKSGVPGQEARGIGVFEASSWVPSKVAVRSAELGREATHAIRELAHNARKGVFAGRYLNRRRPTK